MNRLLPQGQVGWPSLALKVTWNVVYFQPSDHFVKHRSPLSHTHTVTFALCQRSPFWFWTSTHPPSPSTYSERATTSRPVSLLTPVCTLRQAYLCDWLVVKNECVQKPGPPYIPCWQGLETCYHLKNNCKCEGSCPASGSGDILDDAPTPWVMWQSRQRLEYGKDTVLAYILLWKCDVQRGTYPCGAQKAELPSCFLHIVSETQTGHNTCGSCSGINL